MLDVSNLLTQNILAQSSNIGYLARGMYRGHVVPDDRKADYLFRDYYSSIMCAYLYEMAFRLAEKYYTVPLITEALGLSRMKELYGQAGNVHGHFPNAINYKALPNEVRSKLMGTLVKDKSSYLVPNLLRRDRFGDEVLIRHLERYFNFDQYVSKTLLSEGTITQVEAEAVRRFADDYRNARNTIKSTGLSKGTKKSLRREAIAQKLGTLEARIADELKTQGHKVQTLVHDFMKQEAVLERIGKIQRSARWGKMIGSTTLVLIFWGIILNKFDFQKVQPWQKKLYETRGTTSEVVKPIYQGLLPAALSFAALMQNKVQLPFMKKLGPVARFGIAGFIGQAVYGGIWYALFKKQLQKPPPLKPMEPNLDLLGSSQPLRHAQPFFTFEQRLKQQI